MGCGGSTEENADEIKKQKIQNKAVSKQLENDAQKDDKIIKLLLLGAGGSGKSTLFKQLQFIHKKGFQPKERRGFISHIHGQCIDALQKLIDSCEDRYNDDPQNNKDFKLYNYDDSDDVDDVKNSNDIKDAATFITSLKANTNLIERADVVAVMLKLWQNETIQMMFALRNEIAVPDSTEYYFNNMDRITDPNYEPSDEDLLLVRHRTVGMQEKFFTVKDHKFKIVDVGGQRNERKKWIHFFDNVTAVIFVVSLSCYDETTFEEDINGMTESISVFDEQVNSRTFSNTSFILFLNKSDLFQDKIKKVPIKTCDNFSAYNGAATDYNENLKFIKEYFEGVNKNKARDVFQHVTCATNKNNVESVFNDVQTMIITASLADTGLG